MNNEHLKAAMGHAIETRREQMDGLMKDAMKDAMEALVQATVREFVEDVMRDIMKDIMRDVTEDVMSNYQRDMKIMMEDLLEEKMHAPRIREPKGQLMLFSDEDMQKMGCADAKHASTPPTQDDTIQF